MSENSTNDENVLKIYASDTEKLRQVSQLLATEKSNKIFNLCRNNSLNLKEIAKIIEGEENPRMSVYSYHLKNMVECGLLRVEEKSQRKNGHILKFYSSVSFVLIVPPEHIENIKKNKDLRNMFRTVFKNGIKYVVIGLVATITGIFSNYDTLFNVSWVSASDNYNPEITFTLPLVIIIIGLSVIITNNFRKKRV